MRLRHPNGRSVLLMMCCHSERSEQLAEAMLELVRVNALPSCYIRPIAIRAYGEIGVNPLPKQAWTTPNLVY